jgi:hypothetical protein
VVRKVWVRRLYRKEQGQETGIHLQITVQWWIVARIVMDKCTSQLYITITKYLR